MTKKDKVEKVMGEWKAGTLTSHGKKVTNYDQAVAIALSEAGLSKKYNEGGSIEKENALMVANNNKQIAHHTREMESALKDTNYVPAWVVAKVNRSASDLSDATHYLEGQEGKYEKGGNMNKYAKGGAIDAPKIYVADLEAYNNGKLVGEWLDLSDFEDGKDVSKEISKLLKKWGAEEYAIHDVENVPSSIYSEYMGEEDFDKIIKIYKASEENDLPYEVISEIMLQYEPEDLEEWISDYYEGHFDNDTDLAYNVVESIGSVSDLGEKTTEMYFDYDKFGRDLAINDEWEGDFDSDEDRGYDYVENMGGVSELGERTIDMYFDYEKFGRDLAINDYTEIEDGYYFRTPRYAKGGLTNERRYVNKSQDYEVRYAKNRLKRTGYKNERKFAVGGEIGNTVTFSRYGERTTGRITDKLRNGYEVVTDEGTILVEPQEVISFSETPIAKKKRFGFFEGGGSIESKKQAILDFINSFPDKPKNWSEATDDLPELHYDIAEQYGSKYDFDFNKRSSLRERHLRHKQHAKSLLNKLSDEEISNVYSKWEETLEEKFAGGGDIEDKFHEEVREWIYKNAPTKYHETSLDEIPRSVFTSNQLKQVDRFNDRFNSEKFAGGGEIENKIEKLKKVVSSKMLPESVKAKAQAEIDKLEKELENKMTGESEGERNVGMDKESKLDEKEELNATIQKLYGIESKAEDLINYQDGGIQNQSIDKIKKYVEYINKEVSKLDVPFGSEIYDTLQDENAHSLNLTLGLLGFYKNEKDSGEWARTRTSYKDLVNAVNEVKGIKTEYKVGDPIKKPTTRAKFKVGETVNFNNELYKILEIKKAKDLDGEGDATWRYLLDGYGDIMIQEDLLKEYKAPSKPTTRKAPVRKAPVKKAVAKKTEVKAKFKVDDIVGTDKDDTLAKKITSFKTNRKGEVIYSGYYISKPSEKFSFEESELVSIKAPAKPKADHKKLVAKLKAKKGGKEYDNRASLVPFTDKRRERSESSDKKRSALPPGKRVSENGVTYYESRLNRTDLSKKDKFEKGGEVKGSDWGLNLNW